MRSKRPAPWPRRAAADAARARGDTCARRSARLFVHSAPCVVGWSGSPCTLTTRPSCTVMRSAQVSGQSSGRRHGRCVSRGRRRWRVHGPHYCTPTCSGDGRPPRKGPPAAAETHALCWLCRRAPGSGVATRPCRSRDRHPSRDAAARVMLMACLAATLPMVAQSRPAGRIRDPLGIRRRAVRRSCTTRSSRSRTQPRGAAGLPRPLLRRTTA